MFNIFNFFKSLINTKQTEQTEDNNRYFLNLSPFYFPKNLENGEIDYIADNGIKLTNIHVFLALYLIENVYSKDEVIIILSELLGVSLIKSLIFNPKTDVVKTLSAIEKDDVLPKYREFSAILNYIKQDYFNTGELNTRGLGTKFQEIGFDEKVKNILDFIKIVEEQENNPYGTTDFSKMFFGGIVTLDNDTKTMTLKLNKKEYTKIIYYYANMLARIIHLIITVCSKNKDNVVFQLLTELLQDHIVDYNKLSFDWASFENAIVNVKDVEEKNNLEEYTYLTFLYLLRANMEIPEKFGNLFIYSPLPIEDKLDLMEDLLSDN